MTFLLRLPLTQVFQVHRIDDLPYLLHLWPPDSHLRLVRGAGFVFMCPFCFGALQKDLGAPKENVLVGQHGT